MRKRVEKREIKRIKSENKKLVKKLLKNIIIFLVLIFLVFVVFLVLEKISKKPVKEKELKGELPSLGIGGLDEETGIYFLEGCNIENFTKTWKSVFLESSEGINSVYDNNCSSYLIYKFVGPRDTTYANIIYGGSSDYFGAPLYYIQGIYSSLTIDGISTLTSINNGNVGDDSTKSFFNIIYQKVYIRSDENIIDNETEADNEFSRIFKVESGAWQRNNSLPNIELGCVGGECFLFNTTLLGAVYTNLYLNVLSAFLIPEICSDSDNGWNFYVNGSVQNLSITKEDYCIDGGGVMEYYCEWADIKNISYVCLTGEMCQEGKCVLNTSIVITNSAPEFLSNCENIEWEINTSYTLNMETCFEDVDGDNLTYRYDNVSISNISITRNETNLTLTPQINFVGSGSFYIYTNDSKNETQGIVNFIVNSTISEICIPVSRNKTCGNWICGERINNCNNVVDCGVCKEGENCEGGRCISNISLPIITTSFPQEYNISVFYGENQTFSIDAENYDVVEWYVDGNLVKIGINFTASSLSEGAHEIKVLVKKSDKKVSKIWSLNVLKEEKPKRSYLIYIIIIIGIVLSGLVVVIVLLIRSWMEKEELTPIIQLKPQKEQEIKQRQ